MSFFRDSYLVLCQKAVYGSDERETGILKVGGLEKTTNTVDRMS